MEKPEGFEEQENALEERERTGLEERERQDQEKAEDNRVRQARLGDISEESEEEASESESN